MANRHQELSIKDFKNFHPETLCASDKNRQGGIKQLWVSIDILTNEVKYQIKFPTQLRETEVFVFFDDALKRFNEL
jgi:hypothetical protein